MWWWRQHAFISRFRNTIGWRFSHQEPHQHPPTVKYVRKNSKVRPRQHHWDGSLSNSYLSSIGGLVTLLRANTLLFIMFTDWKSHRWSNGKKQKEKKEHLNKTKTKNCCLCNPVIWTSDWSSEAAEIWDSPFWFWFKGWPWWRTTQGQRCSHVYCSDTADQIFFHHQAVIWTQLKGRSTCGV